MGEVVHAPKSGGRPSAEVGSKLGHFYASSAVLVLSTDSMLTRLASDVPNWTVVFYKYLFAAISQIALYIFYVGWEGTNIVEDVKLIGPIGVVAGLVFAVGNLTINYAFQNGNISNTLVILAANPAFAIIFTYLVFKETPNSRTLIAGFICISCVVYICVEEMLSNNNSEEGEKDDALWPILAACCVSVTTGLYFVLLRLTTVRYKESIYDTVEGDEGGEGGVVGEEIEVPTIPINIIACLTSSIVSACLAPTFTGMTGLQWGFILSNAEVLAIAFTLLAKAPKLISAPEVSLYMLIETVLGPIWVFLVGLEEPRQAAIIGGSIMLFTLGVNSVMAFEEEEGKIRKNENENENEKATEKAGSEPEGGVLSEL
jgi:drug/metabolite transporter (DMT)-like permease